MCSEFVFFFLVFVKRLENGSLQEQLETTRSRASTQQLEFVEKLAQANTEVTLLHHTLRGITNELQAELSDEVTLVQNTPFTLCRANGYGRMDVQFLK